VNFPLRLAWQEEKQLDDGSRLDVVEIVCVRDMFPSLFLSWSGQGLISTSVINQRIIKINVSRKCFKYWTFVPFATVNINISVF